MTPGTRVTYDIKHLDGYGVGTIVSDVIADGKVLVAQESVTDGRTKRTSNYEIHHVIFVRLDLLKPSVVIS